MGNNFGFAIGHVRKDADNIPHVFVDDAFSWKPAAFENHTINYLPVEAEITEVLTAYPVTSLTFDQFASPGTIDRLNTFAGTGRAKYRTQAFERTATAPYNWRAAEIFKAAAMMGLIHIPPIWWRLSRSSRASGSQGSALITQQLVRSATRTSPTP